MLATQWQVFIHSIETPWPARTGSVQTIVSHNSETDEQIQVMCPPIGLLLWKCWKVHKASVVLWLEQGLLQVCWGFKGDEERPFEAAEVHALTFSSPVSDSLEAERMTA